MKGINFSEQMFRATIEDRKTQTRIICKPQPDIFSDGFPYKRIELSYTFASGGIEIKHRYKVSEKVYLKEPYELFYDENGNEIVKYSDGEIRIFKNKKDNG